MTTTAVQKLTSALQTGETAESRRQNLEEYVKNPEVSIDVLFEHFEELSAMDLRELPKEVLEGILRRVSAPQLRKLERLNSFLKPLTNEAWKRLYKDQFGEEEAFEESGEEAEEKPRRKSENWRQKYSDGLDRRLLLLTQSVNRIFLSGLATRRVFPLTKTLIKPVVDVYPDDDEYDFDDDMWRNRYQKQPGRYYLPGRKFPTMMENDEWREFPED